MVDLLNDVLTDRLIWVFLILLVVFGGLFFNSMRVLYTGQTVSVIGGMETGFYVTLVLVLATLTVLGLLSLVYFLRR